MQAVAQRSAVRQPFTSARPTPCRAVVRAPVARPQARRAVTVRAKEESVDLSDYTAELDLANQEAAVPAEDVKLRIRMRGYDKHLLADAVQQVRSIAGATGAHFTGPIMLPTRRKVFCVLRSPHVNKDAREHFEIRTHHRLVDLKALSAQTVEAMMQWVPPSGLEVECSIV
jgi:small subunit ribosomal protein S10